MVGVYCQLEGIWNHLGEGLLGTLVKDCISYVNRDEKTLSLWVTEVRRPFHCG